MLSHASRAESPDAEPCQSTNLVRVFQYIALQSAMLSFVNTYDCSPDWQLISRHLFDFEPQRPNEKNSRWPRLDLKHSSAQRKAPGGLRGSKRRGAIN